MQKLSHYNKRFKIILVFCAITFFYFFESAQMAYFNVLAPTFISEGVYQHGQIAALSAAYYYGDMAGLFPVGWALDRFPLRNTLILAIVGSIIGTFLLLLSDNFYVQWFARFISGFFGGTFAFLGGIRIIALLFPNRFSYFMGMFLAAGMFGGLVCQYPLLAVVHAYGPRAAVGTVFVIGLLVVFVNLLFLKPSEPRRACVDTCNVSFYMAFKEITFNVRNLCDVLMVVMLDTPVSVVGTLWGVVLLMGFFHFSPVVSSWVVMALFFGLMLGMPVWGKVADKYCNPPWIVLVGAVLSFSMVLLMFYWQSIAGPLWISLLFFGLGFFSSVQSIGFTWLTKNMRPELIGRNSAYNSVIFMGTNGGIKQFGATLLGMPVILIGHGSSANLLLLIGGAMLVAAIYVCVRGRVFSQVVY